jgi:hypothetical protein
VGTFLGAFAKLRDSLRLSVFPPVCVSVRMQLGFHCIYFRKVLYLSFFLDSAEKLGSVHQDIIYKNDQQDATV